MKKTFLLLIAFFALAVCGYYLIQNDTDDGMSSLAAKDRDFNVKDLDAIGKIELQMPNFGKIKLEKNKGIWHVNDKYRVAEHQLENLFNTISRLSLKYIPHSKTMPLIRKDLKNIGIHVSIYDEDNNVLKGYTIGGADQNERGTFFLMDGATQPYAMELLQFEGSVRGRFFMTEISWRDRTMLREDLSDIAGLTVEYPRQKNISFKLDIEEDIVSPVFQYALKATTKTRAGSVKAYLRTYEKLISEHINQNTVLQDSIRKTDHFCKISIDHIEAEDTELKFYPLASGDFYKPSQARQEETDIIERYLVDCSWGEMYLVQQRQVGRLFQPIEFFYDAKPK